MPQLLTQLFINNSDDAEGDIIYYGLQISTSFTFNNVSYFNGTIRKIVNGTNGHNVSSLNDGYYFWRVYATDLTLNSSFTEIRNFTIDTINPNITNLRVIDTPFQNNPINFTFNLTEVNPANCILVLGNKNTTLSTLIPNSDNSMYQTELAGTYNWYVTCTDLANQKFTSETKSINIQQLSGSGGGGGGGGDIGNQSNVTITIPKNYNLTIDLLDKWALGNDYIIKIEFTFDNKNINLDKNPEIIFTPESNEIFLTDLTKNPIGVYKATYHVTNQAKKGFYDIKIIGIKDGASYSQTKQIYITESTIITDVISKVNVILDNPLYTWTIIGVIIVILALIIWFIFK